MAGPSGATGKLALPYPVGADSVDVPRDILALATKLDPLVATQADITTVTNSLGGKAAFAQGTAAARPVAGTAGRFYYATDTRALSYDTGSAWQTVAPTPALVASLPSSPVDGQECYFLADNATGVVWHLRYRAASSSPYKWECIGGGILSVANSGTPITTQAGSGWSVTLTDGSPSFGLTVPLGGDYECALNAQAYVVAPGGSVNSGIGLGRSGVDNSPQFYSQSVVLGNGTYFANLAVTGKLTNASAGQLLAQFYLYAGAQILFTSRTITARPIRVG